jgi:RimJ/RimL family protein N-acetyltransferase
VKLELFKNHDPQEAAEIVKIVLEYYPDTAWPPTVEKIMKSSIRYYRAIKDGKTVGMSGIDIKTPNLAETVKTIVFKECRGQGLGEELSQAIEDECRKLGIKKVISTIYTFNHQMLQIKLKQGYRVEGFHPHHEKPGFHEYSLGKIL